MTAGGDHSAPVTQSTGTPADQKLVDHSIALEVQMDFKSAMYGSGNNTTYLKVKRGDSVKIVALNMKHLDNGSGWVYGKLETENGDIKDGWLPRTCLGPAFMLVRVKNDFHPEDQKKASMSLAANDIVYVEQKHDSGWAFGRKTNAGGLFVERGWFPYDYCDSATLNVTS